MFHNNNDAATTNNGGFAAASPSWTREEDKLFEDALVIVPEHVPNRWELIALRVPGRSVYDIHRHYEDLVRDVMEIDNGRVELPLYEDVGYECDSAGSSESAGAHRRSKGKGETERRKGIPWSDEEHRLFLLGLQKYGRGDWRSISRNSVVSRTPTQVASHAQKYFLRLKSKKKEKKRASIHDVTTDEVDTNTIPPNAIGNWAPHMTDQSSAGYWPN